MFNVLPRFDEANGISEPAYRDKLLLGGGRGLGACSTPPQMGCFPGEGFTLEDILVSQIGIFSKRGVWLLPECYRNVISLFNRFLSTIPLHLFICCASPHLNIKVLYNFSMEDMATCAMT